MPFSPQYEMIRLLLEYESETKTIRVPANVAFGDLLLHIQNKFDLEIAFKVAYKDIEGTLVLLTDEEDLQLGLSLWRQESPNQDWKLYIID
jgi:hypothetical protein